MSSESIIQRLRAVYQKGGLSGVGKSITDTVHYALRSPNPRDFTAEAALNICQLNEDGFVEVHLPGYRLFVDPSDPGISRELIAGGVREMASYWTYREHLKKLPENPTILEVGANIGYYAIAAAVDRPDAHVICAELDASNVEMLKYNAKENKLTNRLTIDNVALSNESGTKQATVTTQSNLNTLQDGARTGEVSEIECLTGTDYLNQLDVEQSDIDVLRMDVEGHEAAVLEGLPYMNPELVHLEIHPPMMSASEWREILSRLRQWDISLVVACDNDIVWDIDNLDDLPVNESPQVVLSRYE